MTMRPKDMIMALLAISLTLPLTAQPKWKYTQRGIKTDLERLSGDTTVPTVQMNQPEKDRKTEKKAKVSSKTTGDKGKTPVSDRFFGMKTNIACYAGAVANLGAEFQLNRNFSLDMPVSLSLWDMEREHGLRLVLFQPEARYWFDNAGKRHFIGLHAHVAGFNVQWKDTRYQSKDLPLLGAGLSYGYSLRISDNWNFEFTLGAGYAYIRYDTFYNIDNGAQTGSGIYNYWGITRLGLSLVYSF